MKNRVVAYIAVALVFAEVILALVSWLLFAFQAEGMRSMLSGEGLRFLFGHCVDAICSPLLAWLLLLSMAVGSVRESQLLSRQQLYRRVVGWRVAVVAMVFYMAVILLLTVMPHAVLLSATGSLLDSPFSHALVPIVSLGIMIGAVSYGLAVRSFVSLTDVTDALVGGIRNAAPLLFLYVLLVLFYESLKYVFL